MKRSILLVLVYFLIQAMAGVVVMLFSSFNDAITYTLLVADAIMAGLLIYLGYLSDWKLWHPINFKMLFWTILAGLSAIFCCDAISSLADFLPDLMEDTFATIEDSWLGILAIAVVGPILEEMLFRGAITKELLKHYNPTLAILLSALIFGIFHINPAQILTAFLLGLLLAWLYYKTRSLVPGILVHILNNSLSVYFTHTYPDAHNFAEILGYLPYFFCLTFAILLLIFSVRMLKKI